MSAKYGLIGLAGAMALMVGACSSEASKEQASEKSDLSPEMAQQKADQEAYEAMPDTPGTGAYPATKEMVASLPDHVIYHPKDLSALGDTKLGIVLWGNGGCAADGASARLHLEEVASHGYLAIAPGTIRSGPGASDNKIEPDNGVRIGEDGKFPPVETTPEDIIAGLDWALAENNRPESPYYHKIDPKAVAVAGHSCGGLQAIKISADPRIATTIINNSGVLNDDVPNIIQGLTVNKSELSALHAPILYILGGSKDVAFQNGSDDFKRIDKVPAALASIDVGHGGTFHQSNGGKVAQVSVAWLNWQLRGDKAAAKMFVGKDCGLCTDPDWTYEEKGLK
ncbi:hypothetical protein [Altericroceibacterium indicum]|nr:hypothetical protein [Altericroceibacterium indicum]